MSTVPADSRRLYSCAKHGPSLRYNNSNGCRECRREYGRMYSAKRRDRDKLVKVRPMIFPAHENPLRCNQDSCGMVCRDTRELYRHKLAHSGIECPEETESLMKSTAGWSWR